MNNETVCFTIEPYVYISIKKGSVLLYNTLNRAVIWSRVPAVVKLVKQMNRENRLNVIPLDWPRVKQDNTLYPFIKKARQHFIGSLLPVPGGAELPVQLPPMVGLAPEEGEPGRYDFAGEGITHLKELTFYINGDCRLDCDTCGVAYRQFFCCRKSRRTGIRLDWIKKALDETGGGFLKRININGGNILAYPDFQPLIRWLETRRAVKALHIHYLNLSNLLNPENPESPDRITEHRRLTDNLTANLAAVPLHPSFIFHIFVTFPLDEKAFKQVIRRVAERKMNDKITCIVQSENQLIRARQLAGEFPSVCLSLAPCLNGRNMTFFKKYVYTREYQILDRQPSIADIYSRSVINRNFFGRLLVQQNGDVLANIHGKPLGNIADHSLHQIIYKELSRKNHWLKTRDRVEPCRRCHYCFLCPSISNYENHSGRYNLCTLFKGDRLTGKSGKEGRI